MQTRFTTAGPVSWGVPPQPWHVTVEEVLLRRYLANGWSTQLFVNDWALLRRACGIKHPAEVSVRELEDAVLRVGKQGTRANYVARFRSLFNSLRITGVVPASHRPDDDLPKLRRPRSVPRPISKAQAELLITQAEEPFREWFVLGCLAGLRAMEVANIHGSWLEQQGDGAVLRVEGKGGTSLTIPAHPLVQAVVESHHTFGRLYPINPNKVSDYASKEMRRLGVNATFHACRHFFGTYLHEQCGDLLVVSELMRHGSLNTTRGYAALNQGRKRDVLTSLFAGGAGFGGNHVAAP